ncbi:unnamed protein product [Diabrotica balteata]|uniref:Uncharacterized protein n=1 Tax=Diabrotica balteata TaxID=107213 RepID=A0A9N9XAJ0_DIABA|nr:unnamed protein product [Diabrotica balteata]
MVHGTKADVFCPEATAFYNGKVDLGDQISGLYEMLEKVFFRLTRVAAVNSWITYNQLNRKTITFKNFLLAVGEDVVTERKSFKENEEYDRMYHHQMCL